MSTALDPFEQALRAELHGVNPPDGIGVDAHTVLAGGRRVRRRRRLAAGVTALVVVALVVLGTSLRGGRQEAVPASTPTGLTLVRPSAGLTTATYGVTVGTGRPAFPSGTPATSATVWSQTSGRWGAVVSVPLDPGHRESQWVVVPGSGDLVGFVPSAAARQAVVSRDAPSPVTASSPTTAIDRSSWSAFVTVAPWVAVDRNLPASPTQMVWWAADRVPVDADGRRGSAATVDGVAVWIDATRRLWGYESAGAGVALSAEAGLLSGSSPSGSDGHPGVVWTVLVPPDVPSGAVQVLTSSGTHVRGVVGRLGASEVLVATSPSTRDPVTRVEWDGAGGRKGSFDLHSADDLATSRGSGTVGG